MSDEKTERNKLGGVEGEFTWELTEYRRWTVPVATTDCGQRNTGVVPKRLIGFSSD